MVYLNTYEKLGHLGKGASAKIFKVRHLKYGYIRAIRELNEHIEDENAQAYQTFLEECKVLLQLGNGGHPNIVRIYQPGLFQNTAFVEIDYIKGNDLNDYLTNQKHFIPFDEVKRFILDITGALSYCHVDIHEYCMNKEEDDLNDDPDDGDKVLMDEETRNRLIEKYGVTHNDIHSKNIMRKHDGSYILLDFGLAIKNGQAVKSSSRRDGALEYKAPEKWEKEEEDINEDKNISARSDIYSLGILMFEMLAGKVPFPCTSVSNVDLLAKLREQHFNEAPPTIEPLRRAAYEKAYPGRKYQKDFPDWLEGVIMKCLEKKPENRYTNAKVLHEEIKRHFQDSLPPDPEGELKKLRNENKSLSEENKKLKVRISQPKEKQKNNNRSRGILFPVLGLITGVIIGLIIQGIFPKKKNGFEHLDTDSIVSIEYSGYLNHTDNSRMHYSGTLINGIPNGDGEAIFENGERYDGEWEDGQPNGFGAYYEENGKILNCGGWIDGEFSPSMYYSQNVVHGVNIIPITGGIFTMGSPESEPERDKSEQQRKVVVGDFFLSENEITNEEFCRFLNDKNVKEDGILSVSDFGRNPLVKSQEEWGVQYVSGKWIPAPGKENYPVINVTWYGAKAFCDWAGGRLPTEEEWEYACRAGTETPFYTGDNITIKQANYAGTSPYNNHEKGEYLGYAKPVGSYKPNAWGLYDMSGNVSEWCDDLYNSDAIGDEASYRVLRGGSWSREANLCRSASRSDLNPERYSRSVGFRLAIPL